MSGHSKWAKIKRAKGANDAKKGALFSRLSKKIAIAAKAGGSADPSANFQLRSEIEYAKAQGMPQDNIERAAKKAFDKDAAQLSEVIYEGYGPFATAFIVEVATDNTNRAVQEVKHIFSKNGGSLGAIGSVAWMFETKGQILIDKNELAGRSVDELELLAIDAGAIDVVNSDDGIEVYTKPEELTTVKEVFAKESVNILQAEVIKVPNQTVGLDEQQKAKVETLYSQLEDNEDVVAVHTNADF